MNPSSRTIRRDEIRISSTIDESAIINLNLCHLVVLYNHISQAAVNQGQNRQAASSTTTFTTTVIIKYVLNGCFWVLWRNSCWPRIAPGHPPTTPNSSN